MIVIKPLIEFHCPRVAQLHLSYLRTNFRGTPGKKLLQAYYKVIAGSQGAVGFVGEENGYVSGFVCGVWDPTILRSSLLRRRPIELLFWGGVQAFTNPKVILKLISKTRGKDKISLDRRDGYELRPIVLDPAVRGSGLAASLVSTLLADASLRGYQKVYLYTEEENEAANRFYHKIGFQLVGKSTKDIRVYNYYERSTMDLFP